MAGNTVEKERKKNQDAYEKRSSPEIPPARRWRSWRHSPCFPKPSPPPARSTSACWGWQRDRPCASAWWPKQAARALRKSAFKMPPVRIPPSIPGHPSTLGLPSTPGHRSGLVPGQGAFVDLTGNQVVPQLGQRLEAQPSRCLPPWFTILIYRSQRRTLF